MKFFNLLLCLFLAGQTGQGQSNYRVIGPVHQIGSSINTDFFIRSIEDRRDFRANLGIVNRGARKDLKRPLIPENGFFDSLLEQMNSWIQPEINAEPVVATLKELYLWESQGINTERGFIRLEMAFSGAVGQEEEAVTIVLSGEELNVANGHAPRLEAAFFRCLQAYNDRRKTVVSVSNTPQNTVEQKTGRAGIMAASNFLNLWKGELFPISGNLRRKGISYRYQLKRGGEEPEQFYYAIMKEGGLFIWAGQYTGTGAGKYYTRVLEQGRYLFMIDEISLNRESKEQAEVGQFSNTKVGVVIDMETGVPQIVDDELMKQLMQPYPALQEKYLFKDILKFPFQLTRVQNVIAEINRLEQDN